MVRISEDLPAPFGPSSPNMPAGTSSETSSKARTPLAYVFDKLRIASMSSLRSFIYGWRYDAMLAYRVAERGILDFMRRQSSKRVRYSDVHNSSAPSYRRTDPGKEILVPASV